MKSRNRKIMGLYQLENHYLQHRKKVNSIENKDSQRNAIKNYKSQIQMINTYRKGFEAAEIYKKTRKEKNLLYENKIIRKNLLKQYEREKKPILSNRQSTSLSRSRSLSCERSSTIEVSNKRLSKKITQTKSLLSRDGFRNEYNKNKQIKNRLSIMNEKNKKSLKNTLMQMNIMPVVSFPKIKR